MRRGPPLHGAAGARSGVFIRRPPGWPAGDQDARIAPEPQRHRDLAVGAGVGRQSSCRTMSRPAAVEPLRHRLGARSRAGGARARRAGIPDHAARSRPPAAGRPAAARAPPRWIGARAVVEEVQHLMNDDDVEGIARQRQIVDVALPHAAMAAGRRGRGARAPAPACRATDRGRARARAAGRTARACVRCRCRDRASERNGLPASAARIAASTASSATCSLRMRSHSRGVAAEIGLRRGGARGAHGGEPLAVARDGRVGRHRAGRSASRASSALPPRSPRRKKAQEPSRKRSTRPASTSSRRWREMRGCDWRRMSVRSDTVSSASAEQRQDAQPGGLAGRLQGAVEGAKVAVGQADAWDGSQNLVHQHKDIFIPLMTRLQEDTTQIGNGLNWLRTSLAAGLIGIRLGAATPAGHTLGMSANEELESAANPYGLREGEVAVALPRAVSMPTSISSAASARRGATRAQCPKNGRESDAVCTVELDPRWVQGLRGLEGTSHVVLLYWMDKARRDLVLQAPRHYGDSAAPLRCARRCGPIRSP